MSLLKAFWTLHSVFTELGMGLSSLQKDIQWVCTESEQSICQ